MNLTSVKQLFGISHCKKSFELFYLLIKIKVTEKAKIINGGMRVLIIFGELKIFYKKRRQTLLSDKRLEAQVLLNMM